MSKTEHKEFEISKRLLKTVLGIGSIFGEIKLKNNMVHYRYRYRAGGSITNASSSINICELAIKSKRKAKDMHYYFNSDISSCEVWKDLKEVFKSSQDLKDELGEPKAIFECFEWVLNEEINKKALKEQL